jgi:hypothetical protein
MNRTLTCALLLLTTVFIGQSFAQGGPTDSGYALPYRFFDSDSNGINDNYVPTTAAPQYKYEFGIGYGYGFIDADSNVLNDIFLLYPNAAEINPLIDSTRLQGLERIKRADLRHGEVTDQSGVTNHVREHILYNGHCKSDSIFNTYGK